MFIGYFFGAFEQRIYLFMFVIMLLLCFLSN